MCKYTCMYIDIGLFESLQMAWLQVSPKAGSHLLRAALLREPEEHETDATFKTFRNSSAKCWQFDAVREYGCQSAGDRQSGMVW